MGSRVAVILCALASPALAVNVDLSASSKTYVVEDHDRSGQVSPGDVIVYSITLVDCGTESAARVVVTDPIPLGSRFVLGSIRWNGENVSDVDGYYSGPPRIQVTVSSLGAGEDHRQAVQFKVRIATDAEQVDSIRTKRG